MNKHTIQGNKGVTVCYTINNLRVEADSLKFDAFRFYSPAGDQTDGEGFKYFDVPADEVQLDRDPELDTEIQVVHRGGITTAYKFYPDATENIPGIENTDSAGDTIINIRIPTDTGTEITVSYKEVTDASN